MRTGGSRTRPPGITEQTLLVCLLIGSTQMTWGTIVPALPLYLDRFGATPLILGPIIAAFGLGRAIVNIPAGVLLRWWRPRPFLVAVSCLLIAVTAATGLSPDSGILIAARVLAGLFGGAAITIGFAVLVAGAPPERRGRVMSTATAVQMSAGAVGAFLGGLVLSWFPLEAAFVTASVPLALCLVWDLLRPAAHYWHAVPRARRTGAGDAAALETVALETSVPPKASQPTHIRPTALRGIVIALALASFAGFFARFGGEQGLIPLLGYAQGGLTPFTLGLALAAATVVSLAAMPVLGALIDRGPRLAPFLGGVLISAAAMLGLALAQGAWQFALVIVVYGLASSVASVIPSVVMSDAVPGRLGGFVVGLTRTAGDVGAVVGPLVVLAVYDLGGAWIAAGVIAVVLVLANSALVGVLARGARVRRRELGGLVPSSG